MKICEFVIIPQGRKDNLTALAGLLRSLPQRNAPKYPWPVVLLDGILSDAPPADAPADGISRQSWFWVKEEDYIIEEADHLVVYGLMRDAPPLLLMLELFRRFPSLKFDCYSTTEHEQYEHWRAGPDADNIELIEEIIIDAKSDKRLTHYVKTIPKRQGRIRNGLESGV